MHNYTYKSAQKYKFVSKISKKEYENNIKEIKKIDTETIVKQTDK